MWNFEEPESWVVLIAILVAVSDYLLSNEISAAEGICDAIMETGTKERNLVVTKMH